jgi:hypothetical protein
MVFEIKVRKVLKGLQGFPVINRHLKCPVFKANCKYFSQGPFDKESQVFLNPKWV